MNPTDRLRQSEASSHSQNYQPTSNTQLSSKQKPSQHATSSGNGVQPTEAEASKMLEAALLQMDGIIMGETFFCHQIVLDIVSH